MKVGGADDDSTLIWWKTNGFIDDSAVDDD